MHGARVRVWALRAESGGGWPPPTLEAALLHRAPSQRPTIRGIASLLPSLLCRKLISDARVQTPTPARWKPTSPPT